VRSGGLGGQSSLESLSNLVAVGVPLLRVGGPVAVDELGLLQVLDELGQVNAPLCGVGVPSLRDRLAPGSPIVTGSFGAGERGEGRTGGGDGLSSNLGVVVNLPLVSVLFPGLGKLVLARDKRKVGGNGRSWVFLGESFTPSLPGLVLALGVVLEEDGVFRRRRHY